MCKIILLVFLTFLLSAKWSDANVRSIASVRQLLKCASSLDYACILDHVEDLTHNAYSNLIKQADAEVRKSSSLGGRAEEESPSSILTTISNIISELPDLLRSSLTSAFVGDDADEKPSAGDAEDNTKDAEEDEDEDEEEEDENDEDADSNGAKTQIKADGHCKNGTVCRSRSSKDVDAYKSKNSLTAKHVGVSRKKKKKGKFKKIHTIIKVITVAVVLIIKLNIFLKLLAAKLQIKFFLIAIINLLITIARFWWDLKKGHHDHPQKVIYYEHAQHQHLYDGADEHDWHDSSGPSESYWGRADETNKKTAQDIAYSKQAPGGTTYSRINDKPNFSWNPWAERSL